MSWIYYSQNAKSIKILDFLSTSNLDILWINPQKYSFNKNEIQALLQALTGFRCILWYITPMNHFSSQKMNEIKRAFGKWKNISNKVFFKSEHFLNNEKYYSDITILSSSEICEGEAFFSKNTFGFNSSLAFFKTLDVDCSIFEPLADIWLKFTQKDNISSQYKKLKVNKYINNITKQGGIAALIAEDTETCKSIILLSQEKESLQQAYMKLRLESYFNIVSDDNLSIFIKRGIGLKSLS
ncbi:MAG: hypothetical protein AAF383_21105 [Cyanobacteria bacterium P01_A01_bin.83]